LLGYLVEKNSVGLESSSWKELVILKRVSLWEEQYGKLGSQKLSLMLKSPVMMRTLLRSMLQTQNLRVGQANESCIKLTQENLTENSV